jgi:hypothetical protein
MNVSSFLIQFAAGIANALVCLVGHVHVQLSNIGVTVLGCESVQTDGATCSLGTGCRQDGVALLLIIQLQTVAGLAGALSIMQHLLAVMNDCIDVSQLGIGLFLGVPVGIVMAAGTGQIIGLVPRAGRILRKAGEIDRKRVFLRGNVTTALIAASGVMIFVIRG